MSLSESVSFSIPTFPEELESKAGSLFEGPCPITRNDLISEIWKEFFQTDVDELVYLYKERSLVLGRTVTFEQNQQTYQGLAKDISDTGQLLVQLDKQEEIWPGNSGEISSSSGIYKTELTTQKKKEDTNAVSDSFV